MISELDHKNDSIVDKIHALLHRSYREEAKLLEVEEFPPLQRTVDDLKATDARFFGFWKDNYLVAVIEVTHRAEVLNIWSLVVDPSFFRRGFASLLLRYVLESFPCDAAVVETAVANRPAIALYQSFGFVEGKTWQTSHGISKVLLRAEVRSNANARRLEQTEDIA